MTVFHHGYYMINKQTFTRYGWSDIIRNFIFDLNP